MKHILQLIRYKNLLMIVVMQLVFRYAFLIPQGIPVALKDWQYVLLILATVCLAAGGYIINDIMDVETDRINRPHKLIIGKSISQHNAYNYYMGFTTVGVVVGFYLANVIDKSLFTALFVGIAGTLYYYAVNLKKTVLIGNIVISLLVAMSLLVVGLFDLLPMIFPGNQHVMKVFFEILLDYAFVLFFVNLIREIVKDIEDKRGDIQSKRITFPIKFGRSVAAKTAALLTLIPVSGITYYLLTYLPNLFIANTYVLLTVVGPLIYFMLKVWTASETREFAKLSVVLKLVMLFGVLSIAVITYDMLR